MKKRTLRYTAISPKWESLVFKMSEILSPTKDQKKQLNKLWIKGYSHKDAALELQKGGK